MRIENATSVPDLLAIEAEILAGDPDSPLLDRIADRLSGMAAEASA
jgi:hypothetical protein